MKTIIEVKNLKKYFPIRGGVFLKVVANLKAVDNVSFTVKEGQTLGIVGESGCGKSTLGKTILKLHSVTGGQIFFEGEDISHFSDDQMRPLRKNMQIIFQDPFFSLNPKHTIQKIMLEPLQIHNIGSSRSERLDIIRDILSVCGMRPENTLNRYPHEFSGGQRQRIGIARALILNPKVIIADEPVSALDVSIQSQILNLLKKLQKQFNLTYLFISHDLAVVQYISTHIMVMYLGQIVEYATAEEIYKEPKHPYTKALVSAIPIPDPNVKVERILLKGDVPSPIHPPQGCRFHPRCAYAKEQCKKQVPQLENVSSTAEPHWVSCFLTREINKSFS